VRDECARLQPPREVCHTAALFRRSLILGALGCLGVITAAPAQEPLRRVGILSTGQGSIDRFRSHGLGELARLGWREGRNLELVVRSTDGDPARLRELAAEILASRPDVVIAVSNPAAIAVRGLDPAMRIVMGFAGTDPVADGLVQSLARPGGRVTGVVMLAQELDIKRIEIARDILPAELRRVGFLAGATFNDERVRATIAAGQQVGLDLVVARAGGAETLEAAFAELAAADVRAVVVASFPFFATRTEEIVRRAASIGALALCEWRAMAEAGCAVSYGPSARDLTIQVGDFVARILRGEDPATMAMQQAARFEFVVNRKVLEALGREIAPVVLMRADEIID
jgi:putative ABC transport system substrate-binding protein